MKILHLYKDYHPVKGGIENYVKVLAESQAAAGHDARVLVCSLGLSGSVRRENGVRVIRAGRLATLASMPISPGFFMRALAEKPDVAHVHSPYPQGEFANMLLGRATATVVTHHADVVRQKRLLRFYGPLWRLALQKADIIAATSPNYIATSPWLQPVQNKCRTAPLGVDLSRFSECMDAGERDPNRLLFVGKHRYYKDLGALLQAMASLPNARLTVAGDGPMRAEWEQQAVQLGVAGRTEFVGEVPDAQLPPLYCRSGVFVLPASSRAEAFGTVLLEAMACGLPCVATEVGTGTSWVVQDGQTGLVVPPGNPDRLAAALRRLAGDPAWARQLGEAGRNRVAETFTQEKMCARVQEIYAEVLAMKA